MQLARRAKGDAVKIPLAKRLREESALTLARIAERLPFHAGNEGANPVRIAVTGSVARAASAAHDDSVHVFLGVRRKDRCTERYEASLARAIRR